MRPLMWLACFALLSACAPNGNAPMSESESSSSLPKGDTSSLPTGADNQPCFENQKAVNGKCVAQGQGGG